MINFLIECDMLYHMNRAFNEYGIEGTEQKIKDLYKKMPIIKEKYLQIYKKLIKGE